MADHGTGSPYPRGIPSPERTGFIDLGMATGARIADFSETNEAVAEALGRQVCVEDRDGYVHEIIAAAIHPDKNWMAWVEYICNDERPDLVDIRFFLRAEMDGELTLDWEVETYNPYFGCAVGHLRWYGTWIAIVYREKHATYVAMLSSQGEPRRMRKISDLWCVDGDVLVYLNSQQKLVCRLSLAMWKDLPNLSLNEACAQGYVAQESADALDARVGGEDDG